MDFCTPTTLEMCSSNDTLGCKVSCTGLYIDMNYSDDADDKEDEAQHITIMLIQDALSKGKECIF